MENYIVYNGVVIPVVGASSFSTGDGLDLSQRFAYDYSKNPQSLVFRKRNTALTASMQLSFTNQMCIDNGFLHIFDYIDKLQSVVGELVELWWNWRKISQFIVVSAQFSAVTDCQSIFPAMAVSLAFTEGFVKRETLYTAVSTLG